MGNIIFPSDDMSAYRITAPQAITDEDEQSLFKQNKEQDRENDDLSHSDKKTYELIAKKELLHNFGISVDENKLLEQNFLQEAIAYALLKKDLLRPAIETLGIRAKHKQDWSNRLFRLALSSPSKKKFLLTNVEKLPSSDIKVKFPKR